MLQLRGSSSVSVISWASSILLDPRALPTSGRSVCLLPSWLIPSNICQLRFTFLLFGHLIFTKGFPTLCRITFIYNMLFVGSNAHRAPPRQTICLSPTASCWWSGDPWTNISQIIACFGWHALWGILVSFVQQSLPCPTWPASCPWSTWLSTILQWMHHHPLWVCTLKSRHPKQTPSTRDLTSIVGPPSTLRCPYYDGLSLPKRQFSTPPVSSLGWSPTFSWHSQQLAMKDYGCCQHHWEFFKPQLPHWCHYSCCL